MLLRLLSAGVAAPPTRTPVIFDEFHDRILSAGQSGLAHCGINNRGAGILFQA